MKLTGRSLKGDFLRFIIPSIAAQWVFTLYTMIDGIFVARGVSEIALTAVNLSFPFVSGLFSFSILFAVGTSTVVAILLGEGKKERADEVFTQNLAVLTVISVILTAAVLLNLDAFSRFLGATEESLPYVKEYVATIAPFAAAFILSYTFEILIKTDGFPKKATMIVILGAVLNCILDYLMVIVWRQGVFGAAFATGISQVVVILFYLEHFGRKKGILRFRLFHLDLGLIWREFKNGLPSGVTEFSAGIIIFFFNQAILKYLNEEALVSYTIISYVNSIVVMSMNGIAQGSQPLISFYYGQRKEDVTKRLRKYGMIAAAVVSAAAFLVCWFGADAIVSLFLSKNAGTLREYSDRVFRIFSLSFLLVGYNVVIGGYFTAVERPAKALLISMARGFVTILGSLWLMTAVWGGSGIWWAPLVSEGVCLVLTVVLLHRQSRKRRY